jgi:hypothetical protein
LRLKYTKRGGGAKGTQGWNKEGIGTYNSLLQVVITSRNTKESKHFEGMLKRQWNADNMNCFQDAGRILNNNENAIGCTSSGNEFDADIVDVW